MAKHQTHLNTPHRNGVTGEPALPRKELQRSSDLTATTGSGRNGVASATSGRVTGEPLHRDRQQRQQGHACTSAGAASDYLTTPEAAAYLRLSKSFLDKARVYGGGPEFVRLGRRKVVYRKHDLDDWVRQQRYRSTSEYRDDRRSDRWDARETVSNIISLCAIE